MIDIGTMKKKKEVIKFVVNTKVTFIPEIFAQAHEVATKAGWTDWKFLKSGSKTVVIEKIG